MNAESTKLYRSRDQMKTRTLAVLALTVSLTANVRSSASTGPAGAHLRVYELLQTRSVAVQPR